MNAIVIQFLMAILIGLLCRAQMSEDKGEAPNQVEVPENENSNTKPSPAPILLPLPLACFYRGYDPESTEATRRQEHLPPISERMRAIARYAKDGWTTAMINIMTVMTIKDQKLASKREILAKAEGHPGKQYQSSDEEFAMKALAAS